MSGADIDEQPVTLNLQATLTNEVKKSVGRKDFQRGLLTQTEKGCQVECFSNQASHRIKQLSRANCFIVLDQNSGDLAAGSIVNVQPFSWLYS